jgi:hypothetical protein
MRVCGGVELGCVEVCVVERDGREGGEAGVGV